MSLSSSSIPKEGFILTSHWRDCSSGSILELWLATATQPVCITIEPQPSVCFFLEEQAEVLRSLLQRYPSAYIKPVNLKHFSGKAVSALYSVNQRQHREIKAQCELQNIPLWEADIKPVTRYLMERFITAGVYIDQAKDVLYQKQSIQLTAKKLLASRYSPSLNVMSLDIETSMDARQLYSIAAQVDNHAIVFMVGQCAVIESAEVVSCSDEKDCLQGFIRWFVEQDPDIIIGWHVVQFDCWVLQKIADRLGVPLMLGRGKQRVFWREDSQNYQRRYISIAGRVVLDGIELLRAAFYHFEHYSLQSVAENVLGKSKLIESNDRGQTITDLFRHDKPALAAYNIQDCYLVCEIFKKLDLLNFAIERSHLTGLALDRSGGSVASFDYAYLPRLHRAGFIAPNLGELQSDVISPGGYVMRSTPGLYRHVLVLDFKSLYPSIIRTFNIDPFAFWQAKNQQLMGDDVIPGFNGAFFSREKGLLPQIIEELWQARECAKQENNQALSQAIKIIMNSFYGVLGSQGCRFYDPSVCSSITLRGHRILQKSRDWIEAQGHQVIYGDTDSVFVWLGDQCTDIEAERWGRQLQGDLNEWWQQQLKEHHNLISALEIEFETHYTHFLLPTIRGSEEGSKKRYAGLIKKQDEHGQAKEVLVFKGLENVRTDWTMLARGFQQKLFTLVFNQVPYQNYIRDLVKRLLEGALDDDLVYQKKLRQPTAGYIKSTPPHIKAARLFEAHSQTRFCRGERIQYVVTLNGPEPVGYQQSKLDYQHYIDKQLKPIANSVLHFLNDDFESIINTQLRLI